MAEGINTEGLVMVDDQNCYVAFIDILGFKNLTEKEESYNEIKEIFFDLAAAREQMWKTLSIKKDKYEGVCENAYIRIMSDSIVIAVRKKEKNALLFVCRCCLFMQIQLLDHSITARGGISDGSFYGNGELTFGSGLTNAYNLEKSIAINPRIIIQPSLLGQVSGEELTEIYERISFSNDNYYYVEYISWVIEKKQEWIKNFIVNNVKKYERDPNIRKKYLWLKEEYNKYIKKNEITKEDLI